MAVSLDLALLLNEADGGGASPVNYDDIVIVDLDTWTNLTDVTPAVSPTVCWADVPVDE
jgi:hypothetical protein